MELRRAWWCLVTGAGLTLWAGCSDDATPEDGGATSSGTYAAKCTVACRPPEGPCGGEDPAACESDCVVATEGLSATCAQCIADNSGWEGTVCPEDAMCCACSFGPGAGDGCGCGGGCSCAPADESCQNYVIANVTGSACLAVCE